MGSSFLRADGPVATGVLLVCASFSLAGARHYNARFGAKQPPMTKHWLNAIGRVLLATRAEKPSPTPVRDASPQSATSRKSVDNEETNFAVRPRWEWPDNTAKNTLENSDAARSNLALEDV